MNLETNKVLTRNIEPDRVPPDLAEYERRGGYRALRRALRELDPAAVRDMVEQADLRGRGGAGFSTGMKWSFVPTGDDAPAAKHLVVNADEMEPGTFKDRYLLEGDPHSLVESIVISAFATEAEHAWIFLRWAYRVAHDRLRRAIAEAEEAGYIGRDILGTGYDLEVHLHTSAGRYICGEETALLEALEGRRAIPRAKPPFPQQQGLWGQPAVVQNVETLYNVPPIVERGAEWYRGLGRGDAAGTKLYGVSGKARHPGLWELPLGTTAAEILDLAGGMRPGCELRAFLPGGASTAFLGREHLELPLDFDNAEQAGSRLGTGMLVLLDDQTCPVGMCANLEAFFAVESCGWCTPCREGLPWAQQLLESLDRGTGRTEDLDLLREQCSMMGPGRTFCALAPGAVAPLDSAMQRFESDFVRHVTEGGCPWRHDS